MAYIAGIVRSIRLDIVMHFCMMKMKCETMLLTNSFPEKGLLCI